MSKFFLTIISASLAESATFPLDSIKTRLQLHSGRGDSVLNELKREGLMRGLYTGLNAALLRHAVYTTARIGLYEHLRAEVASEGSGSSLATKAIIGAISGSCAQALATPADLIKVRLIADSRSLRPKYAGRIWECFGTIVGEGGVPALYRGAVPSILRAGLVNLGELASYDQGKESIKLLTGLPEGWVLHAWSSVFSGLVATTLSCPADVIKSRTMALNTSGSSLTCVIDTIKQEGVAGLYRGFFPTWLRLGPWQLIFWVSYERGRQLLGLHSF